MQGNLDPGIAASLSLAEPKFNPGCGRGDVEPAEHPASYPGRHRGHPSEGRRRTCSTGMPKTPNLGSSSAQRRRARSRWSAWRLDQALTFSAIYRWSSTTDGTLLSSVLELSCTPNRSWLGSRTMSRDMTERFVESLELVKLRAHIAPTRTRNRARYGQPPRILTAETLPICLDFRALSQVTPPESSAQHPDLKSVRSPDRRRSRPLVVLIKVGAALGNGHPWGETSISKREVIVTATIDPLRRSHLRRRCLALH
jgi:hypothetical protein